MLEKLFEMYNIRCVVSVDDCYMGVDEEELKTILLGAMETSLDNFKESFKDMGKEEMVGFIEQSGEPVDPALLEELLDGLTADQLIKLYIHSGATGNESVSEREELLSFMNMLKGKGYIDSYKTYGSTKEIFDAGEENESCITGGILWLIDKDFSKIGESPEAGIELAKTVAWRTGGERNYVYILSSKGEGSGQEEEDIEEEVNRLLSGLCNDHESSLIYFLYKQNFNTSKEDRVAKSLAQGFKRKLCYEIFALYVECLQKSTEKSEKELYKIKQDTLNYLLFDIVKRNSESHLEFINRFVKILHTNYYRKILGDYYKDIADKVLEYKQLCDTIHKGEKNENNQKEVIKKYREIELYDYFVNKRHLGVSSGDVFEIEEEYYMLVSQPCDIEVRNDGKRTLDEAVLLKIYDDTQKPKYGYNDLQTFGTYDNPKINYHEPPKIYPFDILDLCVVNEDGHASISIGKFSMEEKRQLEFLPDGYIKRIDEDIYPKLKEQVLAEQTMIALLVGSGDGNDGNAEEKNNAYKIIKNTKPEFLAYQLKDGVVHYPVQRVCRIEEVITIDIINQYGNYLSRIGKAFNFLNTKE